MKNVKVVLLLIISINSYAQINRELVLEKIDLKLKAKYGNQVSILNYVDIDLAAIKSLDYPIADKVVDYNNDLSGMLVFTAFKRDSLGIKKGLVGLFKEGNIIWDSDTTINCIDVNALYLHSTFDLNNDGKIEILFQREEWGIRVGTDRLYIYSWDGNSGQLISKLDSIGISEVATLTGIGQFDFVDVDGDGIYEITGLWYLSDQAKEEKIVTYYWNGINYSFDPFIAQPQSTDFLPQNKIDVKIEARVKRFDSLLSFKYVITNQMNSKQEINGIYFKKLIDSIHVESKRFGWDYYEFFDLFSFQDFNTPNLRYKNYFIRKGESDSTIQISAPGLPSIDNVYIQGYNQKPHLDSIITLDDYYDNILINSFEGFTLGPKEIDSPFIKSYFIDSLLNYNQRSLQLGWIANQTTADKYDSLLTLAKSQLQQNNNAARATLQAVLQEVDIDSTNSLTSEAYALLRYNTEYLLEQLLSGGESISTYSVFATHSAWIRQNSNIFSGSIGVNEAGEGPFLDSQLELSVGRGTATPSGYTIKANRIKVKQNATVNADVYYNELDNNGTITGSLNTPLELPLLTNLPEFYPSITGTEDIVIAQNGEYTLLPGSYNEIQVKKKGKLIFTGGEYHINNFNGGDNNELIFQGESEVRIKNKFDTGQGSYIGPQDTTTLSADEIVFYVEGINGINGNLEATPKAAKIGIGNIVKANFYVPNGTLWLRQNSKVEGAFVGKDVIVGINVQVKLNSAW